VFNSVIWHHSCNDAVFLILLTFFVLMVILVLCGCYFVVIFSVLCWNISKFETFSPLFTDQATDGRGVAHFTSTLLPSAGN